MTHGSGVCFNPCVPEGLLHEPEAERALKHYGLDLSYGWAVYRYAFPWANETEIKTLSLTMEQQACDVPGPHFKLHPPEDSFSFVHPTNGTEYTLTVQALEPQTMEQKLPGSEQWLYPMYLTAMCYTISPEQGKDISIYDCAESDKPIKIVQKQSLSHRKRKMVWFTLGLWFVKRMTQRRSCIRFIPLCTLNP